MLIQDQTKSKQRIQQTFQLYDCHLTSFHSNFLKTNWSLNLLLACLEITGKPDNKNIKELVQEHYPKKKLEKETKSQISSLQDEIEHLLNHGTTLINTS